MSETSKKQPKESTTESVAQPTPSVEAQPVLIQPPATPTSPAPKKSQPLSQTTMWILIGVAFVVGGGGGLAIGLMADDTSASRTQQFDGQMPTGGPGGNIGGGQTRGGGTIGKVTKVSSDSITVTDQRSSQSTTYKITSDTMITESGSTVKATDIATGDIVMIRSSDSSTAIAIEVNPTMGGPQQ